MEPPRRRRITVVAPGAPVTLAEYMLPPNERWGTTGGGALWQSMASVASGMEKDTNDVDDPTGGPAEPVSAGKPMTVVGGAFVSVTVAVASTAPVAGLNTAS